MSADYNELLHAKAVAEYNGFISTLKSMPSESVLEHAYEKVIKDDLLSAIKERNLEPAKAKALYKQAYPLDYCYQAWLKNDLSQMDMMRETIGSASDKALREVKSKSRESR